MVTKSLSIEDKNLSTGGRIVAVGQKRYADLDLSFMKRKNGDVFKKTDAAAVKQAVKNLILTNYFEKPFDPYFGSNVRGLLFELATDFIENDVEEEIRKAIENYEPRARVISISSVFTESSNSLDVSLVFRVINTGEIVTIETEISRLR
jgi:phage baseplate assembly protein W